MADDPFTNSSFLVRTRQRAQPYVAEGAFGNLTAKEKIARQIEKHSTVGYGGGFGNTTMSQATQGFSVQLSTDFLELPQSPREEREVLRHFYETDELVGQAIDLHTELPLSKVRLAPPKPRSTPEGFESPEDYGKYILYRFNKMCRKIKLFQRLITIVHHFWLDGRSAIFAEDSTVEVPEGEDAEAFYQKNYQGWQKLIVLPIDRVKTRSFGFTDKVQVELIPSDSDKELVEKARQGDPEAEKMVQEMPDEVRECIANGKLIPLGTDPDEGSFVYILHNGKNTDNEGGQSILKRCLRTLIFREKLRQAQTSIASRAMTPKRLVWAEGLSDMDVERLREQVDLALMDPDFSIVANYQVNWEEMGARDRLLDLSSEYEQTERRLLSGLGVTESLMSGEALYSGDRLKLEIINNRYLHLRELIQEYVHDYLFEPVARRMGFVEKNKWGEEEVLYPRLSFTRLPLRDSQDTFDAMFNLYQKGSLSIDLILEMLNIDPDDTRTKIEQDMFTVNDAVFNEVMRSVYSEIGRVLHEKTDATERVAKYLGLEIKAPAEEDDGEGGGRW